MQMCYTYGNLLSLYFKILFKHMYSDYITKLVLKDKSIFNIYVYILRFQQRIGLVCGKIRILLFLCLTLDQDVIRNARYMNSYRERMSVGVTGCEIYPEMFRQTRNVPMPKFWPVLIPISQYLADTNTNFKSKIKEKLKACMNDTHQQVLHGKECREGEREIHHNYNCPLAPSQHSFLHNTWWHTTTFLSVINFHFYLIFPATSESNVICRSIFCTGRVLF